VARAPARVLGRGTRALFSFPRFPGGRSVESLDGEHRCRLHSPSPEHSSQSATRFAGRRSRHRAFALADIGAVSCRQRWTTAEPPKAATVHRDGFRGGGAARDQRWERRPPSPGSAAARAPWRPARESRSARISGLGPARWRHRRRGRRLRRPIRAKRDRWPVRRQARLDIKAGLGLGGRSFVWQTRRRALASPTREAIVSCRPVLTGGQARS
jgi:hypothetical protein